VNSRRLLVVFFVAGLAVGLGAGFLIGWGVWPVQYYDTDPVDLKQEHKEDYIVLVSATYALNGDLKQAEDRLDKLEETDIAQTVADLAQSYLDRGENSVTTRNLVMLADALGAGTQAMLAYVATSTPTFTPTSTPTATEVPTETPTETPPPTGTSTSVPPTSTSTPVPSTPTFTAAPPTSTPNPPTSTPQPATQTPNPPTATTAPVAGCPGRPGIAVLEVGGAGRDWTWLEDTFGDVDVSPVARCPGGTLYAVTTLQESTSISLAAIVRDRSGNPVPDMPVAFFGFDSTSCPSAGTFMETVDGCRPNACVMRTNQDGEANIPTSWAGSGYDPTQGPGGHAVWVMDSTASDCVTGLGMVGSTFHCHLNVTFQEIGY
jgi:hypothetical protein